MIRLLVMLSFISIAQAGTGTFTYKLEEKRVQAKEDGLPVHILLRNIKVTNKLSEGLIVKYNGNPYVGERGPRILAQDKEKGLTKLQVTLHQKKSGSTNGSYFTSCSETETRVVKLFITVSDNLEVVGTPDLKSEYTHNWDPCHSEPDVINKYSYININ